MGHSRLTDKQEAYAQSIANKEFEYIWEAYDAHYKTDEMSKNAIYVESCRLHQNPKVALRIEEIEAEIQARSMATLDEVLQMMSKRMRVSLKDFFDSDGSVKAIQDLTDEQAMCVSDFTVNEMGYLKTVKLESLKSVWDMFMKKFGAYINVNVNTNEVPDTVKSMLDKLK